jgi:D-glycero-alpha-D-manno-heptose 1-phosphate guanylyltransferase
MGVQTPSRTTLPVTALILAGGFGTRLRSVVSDRPKPMALVNGIPFLEILIDSLANQGVRRFVLLVGYMGEMIEAHFEERQRESPEIRFSHEETPLGTGGAVKNAEAFASDPSLLINGDTFFDGDIEQLLKFHGNRSASVTLSLLAVQDVSRYGTVVTDAEGRISGFREKDSGKVGAGLINAGVSVLSKEFIDGLPRGQAFSMEQDIFPSLALSGKMFGLAQERPFFDIGTPESYEAFKRYVSNRGNQSMHRK